MWRERGWFWADLPIAIVLGGALAAFLFADGVLAGPLAIALFVLGAAFAILARALSLRFVGTGARDALTGLGPEAGSAPTALRLSPFGRRIRAEALRLDRAWRAEAVQLRLRLAAAEAIIAVAPDPLILIDRQRRIVRANNAAAAFVEPGGEPRDLAAALRNPAVLAAADAVLGGATARSVEFALSVPVERLLRAHIARLDGPALDGAAAILSLHDVTALKRSEQMRADFVANAGHELKTPLSALIGFIETLLGPARDDAAARERFLGIMGEQARRMARLVDDLLSLSRIEMNEHVAPTGRVALAPVIDEVARGLELRAGERDVRILRGLPADLPDAVGERDELAQIFQNLLDNAVKYGRPHSEVAVTGESAPPWVGIAVADQGEGIASQHLARLTERFYRVDTARSRELGGTGLGLAIVKHILNRHRGRLDIVSTVGRGSTFTVWLPAAPDADTSNLD